MNTAEIEAFLVLAEELHFGRTAERLGLSQPQVSRVIRSIEWEVGGSLFERTSRRVRLTPLGNRLYDAIYSPYTQLREGYNSVRALAREPGGVLRIACTATTCDPVLTHIIGAFERRRKRPEITLREVRHTDLYATLRNNEFDVLVSWLSIDDKDLAIGPAIAFRNRVLAVAATHQLASKRSVSLEDIADFEVAQMASPYPASIQNAFTPPFSPSGRPLRRSYEVHTIAELIHLVARGRVVHPTVDTLPINRSDVVILPIVDMPPLPLGLIWLKANENQRIRSFTRFSRQYLGSMKKQQNSAALR